MYEWNLSSCWLQVKYIEQQAAKQSIQMCQRGINKFTLLVAIKTAELM